MERRSREPYRGSRWFTLASTGRTGTVHLRVPSFRCSSWLTRTECLRQIGQPTYQPKTKRSAQTQRNRAIDEAMQRPEGRRAGWRRNLRKMWRGRSPGCPRRDFPFPFLPQPHQGRGSGQMVRKVSRMGCPRNPRRGYPPLPRPQRRRGRLPVRALLWR